MAGMKSGASKTSKGNPGGGKKTGGSGKGKKGC